MKGFRDMRTPSEKKTAENPCHLQNLIFEIQKPQRSQKLSKEKTTRGVKKECRSAIERHLLGWLFGSFRWPRSSWLFLTEWENDPGRVTSIIYVPWLQIRENMLNTVSSIKWWCIRCNGMSKIWNILRCWPSRMTNQTKRMVWNPPFEPDS